jgi:hypothetical protein
MVWARRREAWDHTTALMAFVASRLIGEKLDPVKLNPYRRRPNLPRRTPEQIERANREGWRLLETGLRSLCGKG